MIELSEQLNHIRFNTKFSFQNVGQGLFYTGAIENFNFIYDCGSVKLKNLRNIIKSSLFKDLNDEKIDLLILSHFHYDHTSGLSYILNKKKIDTVIIPYFSPIERLILAVQEINLPSWYYKFLSDPISYLFEKGVNRIIIIGGEEGNEGIYPIEIEPLDPIEAKINKMNIYKMKDDVNLKSLIEKNEINWNKYQKEKLLIKTHDGFIYILGVWIFRFFNYKLKEKNLTKFKTCLNKFGVKTNQSRKIIDAVKDSDIRTKIKDCYYNITGNLNNTSLVVYHGPIGNYRTLNEGFYNYHLIKIITLKQINNNYNLKKICNQITKSIGQLLTGDINLNYKYEELKKHYIKYLDKILVTQIPHHGSIKNWKEGVLTDMPNCNYWIASSGTTNRFGHPNSTVILNILNKGKDFYWNNELNKIIIEFTIEW